MSRLPFWLPPDTEIPRPIPKLVVNGFKGPPELRQQFLESIIGNVRQFYIKAAHGYSLGIVDQSALTRETDQYKFTYSNDHGREVVTVEVAASVSEAEEKKEETFPDYAVIDFVVQDPDPDAGHSWLFSAALVAPDVGRDQQVVASQFIGAYTVTKGVEFDDAWDPDYSDGVLQEAWDPPSVIEFGNVYNNTFSFTYNDPITNIRNRIASLKVDFTAMPNHAMVQVDIYASVEPDTETVQDPPVFLGWTQTENHYTDPDYYNIQTATPGDIYLADGSTPNPACITATITFTVLSASIAGSPNPNTICWLNSIGEQQISQGNSNISRADAVDYIVTNYLPPFVFNPPAGYIDAFNHNLFYDDIHQATWSWNSDNSDISFAVPEPYASLGYDYFWTERVYILENDLHYTKRPLYDYPSHDVEVTVSSPCDIVYGFYEKGTHLQSNHIVDNPVYPQCAIWVLKNGEPPTERTQFRTITISSDNRESPVTEDNPKGYGYLGRLTIDRATRSIGWKPA